MHVLMKYDMSKVGKRGEVVKVRDGYARNYLIPQGLAVVATDSARKQFEFERKRLEKEEALQRSRFQESSDKLNGFSINLEVKTNEEGRLFGSVNKIMIAKSLKDAGFPVDARMIMLDDPIKVVGVYAVKVRFTQGLESEIKVWVVEDKPAEAKDAEAQAAGETPAPETAQAATVESAGAKKE